MYKPVPPTTIGSRPLARVTAIQPAASRAKRPALYRSPGFTRSKPKGGTCAGVCGSGLAVPISSPRYTWRASAEITVIGVSAASATATAVLPTPVGPTMMGVRGAGLDPPKPAFQFLFRQLHHRRSPVHIVGRKCRREQSGDELSHFICVQRLARLDRRPARVHRREAFQAVLPPTESAAREIGDQLL